MWLIDDTRDFENQKQFFADAYFIGTFNGYIVKRTITPLSLYYGVFEGDNLIAYYWLMKFDKLPGVYKSHEIHVREAYQNQGIGMFLYERALLVEHHIVLSDHFQTHFSSDMWVRLRSNVSIQVGTYDENKNVVDWNGSINTYGNDHMHLIARAKERNAELS